MGQTLNGHVALVTGSTTGLGLGIANVLGRGGAKVVMNFANNEQRAERAFGEFRDAGGEGILAKADVTSEEEIGAMVERAGSEFGQAVDIVVANATPPQPQRPIEDYDWAFYQQMLDFFVKSLP